MAQRQEPSPRLRSQGVTASRVKSIITAFVLVFIAILARFSYINFSSDINHKLAKFQTQHRLLHSSTTQMRGAILDRQQRPMAVSHKLPSIAVNPRVFSLSKQEQKKVATILKLPPRFMSRVRARKKSILYG